MFTFNQETLQTLEKFSEMNSLTVAKILEFYSNEMQNFYNLILNITDIFINGSPGKLNESRDVDWFATYESILNNKSIHEQFIKLIYERDKKKMNELLSQKIELIQKKFDFQGVEKNYESLEEKYKRISKKFDEFFAFILQEEAEKMLEAQEKDSLNINNNIVLISDKLKTKKKTQFTDNIDYDRLGALQSIRGSSHKKSQLIEKAEFFLEKSAQRRKLSFTETFNNNNPLEIQKNSDNFSNKEERLKELAERKALWLNETYKYLPANKTSIKVQSPHYQNCSLFLLKTRIFIEKNTKLLMEKNIGGISLISLIRTISPLFVEFLKRITKLPPDNLTLNPLFFIFYEYMYNRHSLSKENTETRILKIIQSSFFFKGIARIRNFLRLLGVLGNEKMDGSDLIFYLDCMKQLDDMIIGTFNHDNLLEKTGTIPGITLLLNIKESVSIGLSRAIEIVTKYFKSTLSYEIYKLKLEDMINKLKSIKTPDPLISRKYVVDVDFTIELMFWIRDESRIKFQKVFNALDLEGKDALNQNEFLLLLRNVENYRSTFEELKENFRNEADCIDEEKIDCIGFKKFASVCEKNKWLLQKNLQKFEREVKDEISQIEILNKEWDVKKNLIKLKFIKTNSYNIFYHKVLKIIDECILSRSNGGNKKDDGRMWLLYRLIDDESNMILIDFESEIVLAKELREIKEIFESIHIRKN